MECKFVVGQRVVCIAGLQNWRVPYGPTPTAFPIRDKVYRITNIKPDGDTVYLTLAGFDDAVWDHRAFRPLQDRPKEADTGISVFYPLLKVKEREPI